jgi:hypothetical protein
MRGRIMRGFVRVAPEGYRTEAGLKKWLTRAVDFVATMPRPTSVKRGTRQGPKRPRKK